ncbi:MAG TPA: potassium/proton antiporter [Thermoanaerobaculia bacterium]|nr:potassium/proton antiporter [Thermoanaerobaculia bacterium]
MPSEPFTTATLLLTFGLLLGISALFSRASARAGLPVFLLFLGIGMLAGSEGIGGIEFENHHLAFRLGTLALVLILFDGGWNTHLSSFRAALAPASVLATAGVAGAMALVAVGAHLLGFPWKEAFLLGAVVSSTDAAAVFSVLRASGLQLRRRPGATLELESGLNDPMAVILSAELTHSLAGGTPLSPWMLLEIPLQLAVGAVCGVLIGMGSSRLLRESRLPASGLYPVLTLSIALLTFGLTTLLHGSGFLAVYLAGLLVGNAEIPYRSGLVRFHDAAAWCGQVGVFLVFGLLVFPSRLWAVAGIGLAVALLLAFVVRPLVVTLCLLPFRFPWRESAFIGWVGLRGAVPIVLALFPVLSGVGGGERLFDVVFFVVVVGAIVPGATVGWMADRLGLASTGSPPPPAVLEISSTQNLDGDVLSFYIHPAVAVAHAAISDIPMPPKSSALLVVRGDELIAARGDTLLLPGDHVHVFCRREDRALVELLFGSPEE